MAIPIGTTTQVDRSARPAAEQRPQLAVVCTAGLLAEHGQDAEHGVDLDDLGDDHSLTQDPPWPAFARRPSCSTSSSGSRSGCPGDYEGADDLDDGAAVRRCTTIVTHPGQRDQLQCRHRGLRDWLNTQAEGCSDNRTEVAVSASVTDHRVVNRGPPPCGLPEEDRRPDFTADSVADAVEVLLREQQTRQRPPRHAEHTGDGFPRRSFRTRDP
jgi:hypothetical protein